MSYKQEDLKLMLLEIKRLRQLIKIRDVENTLRELHGIQEEAKTKLKKVKALEEQALKEVANQLDILEEIEIEIGLERCGDFQNPLDTLIEIKPRFPSSIGSIQNRLGDF